MKKLQYRQNIALFLACMAIIVIGPFALYENGGINYISLVSSFEKVGPAVVVLYALGWLIGSMIESSSTVKKKVESEYTNSLLEEILKEEGLDSLESLTGQELSEEEAEQPAENESNSQ